MLAVNADLHFGQILSAEREPWLVVESADLDLGRAERLVLVRAMSYLLWGLEHRLTEDPPRCLRLLDIFGGRNP